MTLKYTLHVLTDLERRYIRGLEMQKTEFEPPKEFHWINLVQKKGGKSPIKIMAEWLNKIQSIDQEFSHD